MLDVRYQAYGLIGIAGGFSRGLFRVKGFFGFTVSCEAKRLRTAYGLRFQASKRFVGIL